MAERADPYHAQRLLANRLYLRGSSTGTLGVYGEYAVVKDSWELSLFHLCTSPMFNRFLSLDYNWWAGNRSMALDAEKP